MRLSGGGSGSGSDLENEMENPYASTGKASCFDLAWAVDKDGNPVTFAGFCDTLMTTESKQELLKGEG